MSNRNFDCSAITRRLQDKAYARNVFNSLNTGQRIITNAQNSNGTVSQFIRYDNGSQTMYFRGLGSCTTVDHILQVH